jgi:peptide subunit release factor 1 (eRF1)
MPSIEDLIDGTGCVASVYLRSPSAHADADHRLETGWKNMRRELAEQGAPDAVLSSLDADVAATEHGDAAAFAFFRGSAGAVVDAMDDEIHRDLATYDRLPRLVPVLESHQRTVPHVIVTTDRVGADIVAVTAGEVAERREVEGEDQHVHRGRFGGWSHRRFQQRAENTWEQNAKLVADEVSEVARDAGARVVVVAGDERASHLLLERLDADVHGVARLLDEGGDDAVAEAAVRLAADVVARDTTDVLRGLDDRTSAGTAVVGVGDVLAALSEGRVETLVVHDEAEDERRAWFEPGDSPVAATSRTSDGQVDGRLVDVAVRSALLTDADIRVVPPSAATDGLAALLRW